MHWRYIKVQLPQYAPTPWDLMGFCKLPVSIFLNIFTAHRHYSVNNRHNYRYITPNSTLKFDYNFLCHLYYSTLIRLSTLHLSNISTFHNKSPKKVGIKLATL